MAEIRVALGQRSYPVLVQQGLARRIPEVLERVAPSKRYFVFADGNVWSHYFDIIPSKDPRYVTFAVPPGEGSKSIETLYSFWTFLLQNGVERGHVAVAIGGGVVGDAAGFAAATVLRGIRLVQVPTSLLAQVDASIGGKTGINHPLGKNLIGAFYQPVAVIIDPAFLRTLPESEFQSGMYEVIKYALIEKNGLYERLMDFAWSRTSDMTAVIELCAQCKAHVVAGDEMEAERRMILNFGHTVGHAIEAAGGFKQLKHGQAVGWGILFAARLSRAMGICDRLTEDAIGRLLYRNGALPKLSYPPAMLVELMRHDKKVRDGRFTFVLPKRIGEVVIRKGIEEDWVQRQLEEFYREVGG
ncbi:MAG: 3-dehydroquinate synthase [Acidobacteria bacterium]|nr:3-dehydroquinate synthase [Acidobacteriota bacterium]